MVPVGPSVDGCAFRIALGKDFHTTRWGMEGWGVRTWRHVYQEGFLVWASAPKCIGLGSKARVRSIQKIFCLDGLTGTGLVYTRSHLSGFGIDGLLSLVRTFRVQELVRVGSTFDAAPLILAVRMPRESLDEQLL